MNLEELCSRVPSENGLFYGEAGFYDQIFQRPELPFLDVGVDAEGITVDIGAVPDSASQMGSSVTAGILRIKLSEAYKINHDFTFGGLTKTTDRKLSEVFPIAHDGSDNMTPDIIHTKIDGSVVVIEFTTTRSLNPGGLEAAFRTKLEKYRDPLERRKDLMANPRIFFGIIVVSSSHVLTNMPLTQDEAEELMYRFCIANEIYSSARAMDADIELQKSEDELEAISRAKSFFSFFDPDLDQVKESFPNSDIAMLQNFLQTATDGKFILETLKKKEREAYDDLKKKHYLDEGLSIEKRLEKNRLEASDQAAKLMEEMHDKSDGMLYTSKSTVKLPPWVVKPHAPSLDVDPGEGASDLMADTPYGELWMSTFTEILLGNVEGIVSNPDKEMEIALAEDDPSKEDGSIKIKYHRFRPTLSDESKQEFSLQGVEGKKWRNRAANQVKEKESHKSLSPFVNVESIDEFLQFNNLLGESNLSNELVQTLISKLLDSASQIQTSEVSEKLNMAYMRHLSTNVAQWSLWVSCLAQELAAALKQHCRPGEFIIKKLLFWPIYVIIKPTKSSSHIFYSLAVMKKDIKKRLMGSVFTDTISSGSWELTEFKSLKTCKLTNLVNLPCTMLNSIAFWREKLSIAPWNTSKCITELREQVALSFLVSLEDKSTTEEIITLTRYTQMEGFVSQPMIPKPQKMLSKLNKPLRTKLQVFLFRRHIEAMVRVASRPYKLVSMDGRVEWHGTFNAITGRSTLLENMVNNWYIGYYKNKEESTEMNALGGMYKKIVEIEEERPESDDFLGWQDTDKPDRHEFSRSFLRSACQSLEKEIETRHGKSWKTSLEERILKELGSKNLLDLATMKASSNFSADWEDFEAVRTKTYHRSKLLEKVGLLIEKGFVWYLDVIGQAWKAVLDDKCMRICLFKKNQHGGLREIYVMDMNSRLVQFGVETMARCVCELSPHETVANPRLKNAIIENHGLKAARQIGTGTINVNSSNDASKWNQGHYTTKLAMTLCWFLPERFHKFVWSGISMFRSKKMMMDIPFLESLSKKSDSRSTDEFRQKLSDGFHGNQEVRWIEKGKTFIKTETGMMQGILHFTSSLLHSCVQSFFKSYFGSRMKDGISGRPISCVIDVVEGSDDSAILLSMKAKSDIEEAHCRFLAAVLLHSVKFLNPLFGIYSSEKSTVNTLYCVEYNSEFHFHRHLVRPTLRWVAASHQISETEALASRQEDYANLLTQCLEGGSSFSLTYLIQCSQMLHHYMLLGMFLHPLFGIFMTMLMEDKDPALGFFMMDHPAFAGGAGFRFNLWRQCKMTTLGRKYAYYFNEIQKKTKDDVDYRALDSTTGGTISHSVMIFWGDRKKYQKLLEKMGLPEDWIEQIDENPGILYRRPTNKDELILKLAEKVHSPGVTSSLSKGHVVPRVVAAGVYMLSRHCFRFCPSIHGRGATQKASLIRLMVMSSEAAYSNKGALNPNQERMLFPQVQEYERVLSILDEISVLKGRFVIQERNIVKSRIELFSEPIDLRCKAEDLIAEVWFGSKRTKLGPRLLAEEWDKLRASFSWLSTDHKETLEKGPFLSHVQFRNFIAHVDVKSRSVRLLGAPVKKSKGVSTVGQVLRSNFFPGFMLDSQASQDDWERLESVTILKHHIFMILNGPYTEEHKTTMVQEAFMNITLPHASEVIKRSRTLSLCLIKNFLDGVGGSILDQIEAAHSGTIGGFTKPQKLFRRPNGSLGYIGKGVWTGVMESTNVQLLIDGDGNSSWLEEVRISSEAHLFDVLESIRRFCDDIGVNNRMNIKARKDCLLKLFNFKVKPSGRDDGCPVRLMSGTFRIRELQNPDEVQLRVRGDILNLSIRLQEGRFMNLLSYRARDTDISETAANYLWSNRHKFSFGSKEPSCSWICMKSLDSWAWQKAAKLIEKDIRTPSIDNRAFSNILRDCLESSLRKQGLLRTKISEAVEKHITPMSTQDLIDILLEDVDFSDVLDQEDLPNQFDFTDIFEEEPKLWSAEIEEFGEAMISLTQSGKYFHLTFMDHAAEEMSSLLGKEGCRQLLNEHKCNVLLKPQVCLFLTLLKISKHDIEWVSDKVDDGKGLDEASSMDWG
nr:MAG: RNA-dependent RNA polymerase [Jingmen bat phenuivirus 2]